MLFSIFDSLQKIGWDQYFIAQIDIESSKQAFRVIGEDKGRYRLSQGTDEVFQGEVRGKFRNETISRSDFPAVGDWVLGDFYDQGKVMIDQVLKRKTCLQRRASGRNEEQLLATNVDLVFIATSANEDLNIRRLERYLAIVHAAYVEPVLLLTKSDLVPNSKQLLAEILLRFPGLLGFSVSQQDLGSFDAVREKMRGQTSVILGSSGVGKSTILNLLLGEEDQSTQANSDYLSKGRHTTTSRSLFVLPGEKGCLIDTPGMRSVGLWEAEEGTSVVFQDFEELMIQCRFSDCRHIAEPGCRILEGIAAGEIEVARWKSYQKLIREQDRKKRDKQQKQEYKKEKKFQRMPQHK